MTRGLGRLQAAERPPGWVTGGLLGGAGRHGHHFFRVGARRALTHSCRVSVCPLGARPRWDGGRQVCAPPSRASGGRSQNRHCLKVAFSVFLVLCNHPSGSENASPPLKNTL